MKSEEDTDGGLTDSDSASHVSSNNLKDDKEFAGISTLLSTPESGSRSTNRLDRKESYKAQRRSYAKEKKRVERELLSTFKDESIIVLADWLKIRGTLKSWTKLWCVLKPGLLLLYKSPKTKSSHWIGTIILSTCELIERPSKKNGFCFKLFHPMDQSIWASRGPEGETMGAVVQPLPTSHLIFRAPNNAAGKCWMDALELALRCSSLLLRTMSSNANTSASQTPSVNCTNTASGVDQNQPLIMSHKSEAEDIVLMTGAGDRAQCKLVTNARDSQNESDVEKHFKSDLDDGGSVDEDVIDRDDDEDDDEEDLIDDEEEESDYSSLGEKANKPPKDESQLQMINVTSYEADPTREVFGAAGDQTEEISDENKSIVWFLMKQVRPGMDLSKVVLPTFILEPRSFLDKISDYYYHADILTDAIKDDSPFSRIKTVVRWYLSGFYKKPKGLKKPYNPILGERFRCYWEHDSGSKTFFIAEQVSHHPPISAFYVTNRQEGYTISASILAKSKFYGNSTSAILDGVATLSLLPRGEDYKLTMPYAHCKGILMGTMTMELGGKVYIECGKTGYSAELEFKLRPFLGGGEFTNAVTGKIKLGKETLATLDGHWDDTVMMRDKKTGVEEAIWVVNDDVKSKRLKRLTVPFDKQEAFESVKLWHNVSVAIENDDQVAATEEKFILEEAQRAGARKRKTEGSEWIPRYFELDEATGQYVYTHADYRAWDPLNDLHTYECDFVICTKTKHKTPMVRTQSIVSVSDEVPGQNAQSGSEPGDVPAENRKVRVPRRRGPGLSREKLMLKTKSALSGSSQDSSKDAVDNPLITKLKGTKDNGKSLTTSQVEEIMQPLKDQNRQINDRLCRIQQSLDSLSRIHKERDSSSTLNRDMILLVVFIVVIQTVINWILSTRANRQVLHSGPPSGAV